MERMTNDAIARDRASRNYSRGGYYGGGYAVPPTHYSAPPVYCAPARRYDSGRGRWSVSFGW